MTLSAINRNIVIRVSERQSVSAGGIALPMQHSEAETEGIATSVGDKVEDVSIGDTVGFPSHLGTFLTIGGQEVLIIDETKCLYVRH